MDLFTRDDLTTLTEPREGVHVSCYMPMQRGGDAVQQNPIQMKNALQTAELRLKDAGYSKQAADDLLQPARDLVDDWGYWRQQSDGLALFLTDDTLIIHRVPVSFEPLVVVGQRFHIKPLLPLLSGDGRFYILALSQKDIRLMQGTRHTVDEVSLEGMPTSLAEALYYDQPQAELQHHTGQPASTGWSDIFHGHSGGAEDEDRKQDILRYFHKIDAHLRDHLTDQERPMVLAGVEYLLPIYREANTYPHLMEEGIGGNPEEMSPEELHERAWPLVEPTFEQTRDETIQAYQQLAGKEEATTSELAQIVSAAHFGRVEALFVARDQQQWGSFDAESGQIETQKEDTLDAEDLLDLAAQHTLKNGGRVYVMNGGDIPAEAPAAAILRY